MKHRDPLMDPLFSNHRLVAEQMQNLKAAGIFGNAEQALKLQGAASSVLDTYKALDLAKAAQTAGMLAKHLEAYQTIAPTLQKQVDQMRQAVIGIDTSGLRDAVAQYERLFRPTVQSDFLRISEMAQQAAGAFAPFARLRDDVEKQMAAFRGPLINIQDSLSSFRGIGGLAAMGAAIRIVPPFDPGLVIGLRAGIGDWRDADIDVLPLLDDPVGRVEAFEAQGFNSELTDFPDDGFKTALSVTHIELGEIAEELAPPPNDAVPGFNRHAYEWLYVFERELRRFIWQRLTSQDPTSWHTRLPIGMHDRWQTAKAEALRKGEAEQPIISYADFSDYADIILKRVNWRDCFQSTFKHEEAVREGFNRLRPIRIIVAHMRMLTPAEYLTLNLEARRFLRAIGVLPS